MWKSCTIIHSIVLEARREHYERPVKGNLAATQFDEPKLDFETRKILKQERTTEEQYHWDQRVPEREDAISSGATPLKRMESLERILYRDSILRRPLSSSHL